MARRGTAGRRPAREPGELSEWQRAGLLLLLLLGIVVCVFMLFGGFYLGWWGHSR